MDESSKTKLLEKWIVCRSELEFRFENFWFNVGFSLLPIGLWWGVSSLALMLVPPFAFIQLLLANETVALVAIIACAAVFILFWIGKSDEARFRTVLLMGAVAAVLFGVYDVLDPSRTIPASDYSLLCWRVYRSHPAFLAGWFALLAWHTLVFVFKAHRAKLRYYWAAVVIGFAALSVIYCLAPPVGFLLAVVAPQELLNRWFKASSDSDLPIRGIILTPVRKAAHIYRRQLSASSRLSQQTFPLAGVSIPVSGLTVHLVVVGSIGSGKSITLKLIMQAALPLVVPGVSDPCRAIVYDPKHNAYAEVMGIDGLAADVIVINPFLHGSARWDISRDITSLVHAQALADILVPEKPHQNQDPFFRNAAVNLLTGVVYLFIVNAPGKWTLADVVRAFQSEKVLKALLSSNPYTAHYAESLGTDKTAANIKATVNAAIEVYRPIAALWEHTPNSISIREWLEGGKIILLSEDQEARPAINALNSLFLTRTAQCLLKEGDHLQPRTYLFLDELQSINVPELEQIVVQGRSKGICCVAAYQSIQGMYHRYGKEVADSFLGQFRTKVFLKQSDAVTAEWSSKQFGDVELKRSQATGTFKTGAAGHIVWSERTGGTEVIQQTPRILPSEFMNIPPVNPDINRGVMGYYQTGTVNYKAYTSWHELKAQLHPPNELVVEEQPVPESWQQLHPWDEATDWERLGIADVMRRLAFESSVDDFSPGGHDYV